LKTIAFVEVKTRGTQNLDTGGAQAINLRKRQKLWQTAELFLCEHSQFSDWNCRFDVALVTCEKARSISLLTPDPPLGAITIGTAIQWQGYQLTLHHYFVNALEGSV
jgi:putative endonuclease